MNSMRSGSVHTSAIHHNLLGVTGLCRYGTNLGCHCWRIWCVAVTVKTITLPDMAKHASKSEQLAVRIEPALRAALEAAAASDRRPVTQYVRNLILDAVDGDRERQVERASKR